MSDLLTRLGLRAAPTLSPTPIPSYTSHFIIANFLLSYVVGSARIQKMMLGIDNNVSPRGDLRKYGPEAVRSGKMTQRQLDKLERQQAAHENAVEHFPFFAAGMVFAVLAGLDQGMVNKYGLVYTLVRAAYLLAYAQIEEKRASYVRSVLWWAGNVTVIRLFWFAGKALNTARGLDVR